MMYCTEYCTYSSIVLYILCAMTQWEDCGSMRRLWRNEVIVTQWGDCDAMRWLWVNEVVVGQWEWGQWGDENLWWRWWGEVSHPLITIRLRSIRMMRQRHSGDEEVNCWPASCSLQYEEQVYDAVMSWVLVDTENRLGPAQVVSYAPFLENSLKIYHSGISLF